MPSVYVNAAFRSTRPEEAYVVVKDRYVLVDYAPGTTDDKVLEGPLSIANGFPALKDTVFGKYGIDCAFGSCSGPGQAYIFVGDTCALFYYAPGIADAKIIKGPTTIAAMFPFLKGTVFESGIDAAFESTVPFEAYLFRGNRSARINYNKHTVTTYSITGEFPSLKDTIFETGVDAAFASHRFNEAYLFKGDSYARFNFAPGTSSGDYIIGGVKKIKPNWPSLKDILPN